MSRLYTARVLEAHAGSSPVYEVPAGFRLVVRCVTGFNANALAPQPVQLILVEASITFYQRSLGAQSLDVTEFRVAIEEGEHVQAETGPDCDLTVTGYLLALP